MNLLVLSIAEFPDAFPRDQFDHAYVADTGNLADYPIDELDQMPTYLITDDPDAVPEQHLNAATDLIEVEDPVAYVISRGIPGDVAVLAYDDSDSSYAVLERLNRAGITVLDPSEDWIEVVIDKSVQIEDVIDAITERVTADVLRIVRAELADTPRRGRFKSPAPRA